MDHAAVRKQVERITSSPLFGAAETLCRLLRYLVEHSLQKPAETIKEHQIAMEVFGRPLDFDPRLDAIVRVQIGRLRARLAEYYAGPGASDPIIVDIPRKTHIATIEERPSATRAATSPSPPNLVRPDIESRPAWWPGWRQFVVVGVLAIGWVLSVAYTSLGRQPAGQAKSAEAPPLEPILAEFWGPMLRGPASPLLVYSNAEFVGNPVSGMRYRDPASDTASAVLDHYTGVGEVVAAVELSKTFARLGRDMRLKRGQLLTLDDAKTNNVIFAGSPAENLSLRDVAVTRDFVFERQLQDPRKGHVGIVNKRPQPGEPVRLFASPAVPIVEDYAIIAISSVLARDRFILVLAGTTTLGTQAAAEFVCRAADLEKLLARLPASHRTSFEAVIRVFIARGVPVRTEIVAVRPI